MAAFPGPAAFSVGPLCGCGLPPNPMLASTIPPRPVRVEVCPLSLLRLVMVSDIVCVIAILSAGQCSRRRPVACLSLRAMCRGLASGRVRFVLTVTAWLPGAGARPRVCAGGLLCWHRVVGEGLGYPRWGLIASLKQGGDLYGHCWAVNRAMPVTC